MSSLHKAAKLGHLAEIKSLTQNGAANVFAKSKKYGELPMHLSAINGHTDCVEYFLKEGVDVNVCNDVGLTCAHLAAYENHLETLKSLIRNGTNIEARCVKNGNRPVDGAAYRGHFECVEYLIHRGSNINSLSTESHSVLYNAAGGGHLKIIQFLVERGANLDVRENKNGNHSIHNAAFRGHQDCLEYFLDLGIDADLPNQYGFTPMMSAASGGHLNIIKLLIERGADVDIRESTNGNHPIHSATFGGHQDCLEFFLDLDIDVDLPNKYGFTPMMSAAFGGHLDIIKYLVERKANLDVQDSTNDNYPIHLAAFKGNENCLEFFLDLGIDVDLPNKYGFTPMMSAASGGHLNIIKYLVERKANLDVQDSTNGNHLIHLAAFKGNENCLAFFLDLGIDVDLPNKYGFTPMMSAASGGHLKTIKLLILQGADINRTEWRTGHTALHLASRHGHYECVEFLVHHSASTEIRNKFNKTPYDLAVENHHTAIADLLRI